MVNRVEVMLSKGATTAITSRKIGIGDHTCYLWKRERVGIRLDHPVKYYQSNFRICTKEEVE